MGDVVDIAKKRLDRRDAARRAALGAPLEAIATICEPVDEAARARKREALGADNLWAVPVESWDGS